MISVVLWSLGAAAIFLWNLYQTPYIGIRFTEQLVGFPLSGGWLCAALALYCLIRYFARKRRDRQPAGGG